MKPQLANDADIEKVIYPTIFQVKIDGVRALNLNGTLTGRSLDPFKGRGITEYFSKPEFIGLDGEMILGENPASSERLCSLTTGAMGKFKGVDMMPNLHWWCFDLINEETINQPYHRRYNALYEKLLDLQHPRLHLVPSCAVESREELEAKLAETFAAGYEGGILRNPHALIKEGRPNKHQQLMRFKPWSDSEAIVTGLTEGNANENDAETNSLGRTERSSAQAGMVPNGRVGSIQGVLLADVFDPFTKKLLFAKGLPVTVSKGEMTTAEATHYWENPKEIIGHIVKFRHMTHGTLNLPRFPNYISHRLKEDM